jgi:hypothetical protein
MRNKIFRNKNCLLSRSASSLRTARNEAGSNLINRRRQLTVFRKPLTVLLLAFAVSPLCAQNGITISDFSANAGTGGAATTLTFNVGWDKNMNMTEIWSDTAWVFADYNNAGTMTRLPLESGATLTAHSAEGDPAATYAGVRQVPNNPQGVWVVGNAKEGNSGGSFSATVRLFTSSTSLAGLCIYAINYPPVGRYTAVDSIQFNGTPPFYITYSNGSTATVTREAAKTPYRVTNAVGSFTDASRAPGTLSCLPPAPPSVPNASFCYGIPGRLETTSAAGITIKWYDAPAGGALLTTGNVFPLTLWCNVPPEAYYAEAVSSSGCPSVRRTQATYTAGHCVIDGRCTCFEAGDVGTTTANITCSAIVPGQIGSATHSLTCTAIIAGQIGPTDHPAMCVQLDAGHIGR